MEGQISKEFKGQEVIPESEREKTKDYSTVRLKEIKIVLRDIQTPRSSWPEQHLQSLCETCKPREIYQVDAKSDVKYKKSNRRKSCDELLNSWKAPTRRHRLPKRLQDFVVDRTVLHLIEFSNWYNMGRVARHCDLHVKSKCVPKSERSPYKGTLKIRRTYRKEQESDENGKMNGIQIQPTSSRSFKKRKMRHASKMTTCEESKHRGRPKKQLNAARTVAEGLHKHRGRPKKQLNAAQTVAEGLHKYRGRPKKQLNAARTVAEGLHKHRGRPKKQLNAAQTVAEGLHKHRGRPKKQLNAAQTVAEGLHKYRGRPKKQLNAAQTVTQGLHKQRGRPKKYKDELQTQTVPISTSRLVRPMGGCQSLTKMKLPKSPVSIKSNHCVISRKNQDSQKSKQVSKQRGRPKKCQDADQSAPISQSPPANHRPRSKNKKCEGDSKQPMPVSQSCHINPRLKGRHTKCKDIQQNRTVSQTTSGRSRPRGRPKKTKEASQPVLIPISASPHAEPKHQGQSKKYKGVNEMDSSSTGVGPKQLSRPRNKRKVRKTETYSLKRDSPVVNCRGRQKKCSALPENWKVNAKHKTKSLISDNAEQLSKCSMRSRKRKFGVFSSKRNPLTSTESTLGLVPFVNPDFSVDDNNSCTMNINEYLTQLGSFLESTDHCETTTEGNVSESGEGLRDENNNIIITDSDALQETDASPSQCSRAISDGLASVSCNAGEGLRDENNNIIITDSDALQETDASPSQCSRAISDEETMSIMRMEAGGGSQDGSGNRKSEANSNLVTDTNNNLVTERNSNLVTETNNNLVTETNNNLVTDTDNSLVTETNNNLVTETDIYQTNDTGIQRSDSGISGVSSDTIRVSPPERSRRKQKDKVQPSSSSLNLRRSERLRQKESYQKYKQLWTDSGICRKSGNKSETESNFNQETLETSLDDDLLHEFVAMCPLESDIPLSDNDCFSLLAESPIFTGMELGSLSGFDMLIEEETGCEKVDVIRPRTPPKVKRNFCKFLLNEHSIHILANQPIHSPPHHGSGGGEGALQGCRNPTRDWKMCPGFGPLVEWQVLILRKLGLEMTGSLEDVRRSNEINNRSQRKRRSKIVVRPQSRSDKIVNRSQSWSHDIVDRSQSKSSADRGSEINEESERRGPQNIPQEMMLHSRKDQRPGDQEMLKLAYHGSPLLVFIHPGGQKSFHAVAEVWLPSILVESNTNSVFFMPMGEWDAIEKWWHVQKILWKSGVDGSWHVISAAEEQLTVGTCFVPEESWLVSQGAGDQRRNRIYHVRQPPRGPGVYGFPCPENPSRTLYLSSDQDALEKNLRKQKQQHSIPIPPVGGHGFLQSYTACHPSVLCPQVMATSNEFNHVPHKILGSGMHDPRPRLIPVFDQPQELKSWETLTASSIPLHPHLHDHGVFQHQGSNIYGTTVHQVTNGHFISLDGYMAAPHDHNYDTRSETMPLGIRPPLLAESMACGGCDDDLGLRKSLEKTVSAGKTNATTNKKSVQSTHNNNNNSHHGHRALLQSNHPSYPVKDSSSNILQTGLTDEPMQNGQESSTDINNNNCGPFPIHDINQYNDEMNTNVFKTPPSLSTALDQIKACEDVSLVGKLLWEWCRSGLSFRRDREIMERIARRLEMGACYQSSQNFCAFVAGFHAASLKGNYAVDSDDECVLVQLGLSAVSRCLIQDQQEQPENLSKQVQDQVIAVQDDPQHTQSQPLQLLDQPHQVNIHQAQNQVMQVLDPSVSAMTHPTCTSGQCTLAQHQDQPSYNTPSNEDDNLFRQIQDELGPVQIQDQTMRVQGKQGIHVVEAQNQTTQVPDFLWLAETQDQPMQVPTETRNQAILVQDQLEAAENQDHTMQVQGHLGTADIQDQTMQIQDQTMQVQDQPVVVNPREDAFCVLQMLHHLKLPLTEVLASLSDTASHDTSPGFLNRLDSSTTVRDVLGILADFDPSMAFTVIQGLGWGHTFIEVSKDKGSFGRQLLALAEALLDCKKFWQCRVLLSHLIAYEGSRQPCKQLYSSLLRKIMDTERDCELAMMVFEDMMESYLVIPTPIIRKLLTLMWQRIDDDDDDGIEDALCVFHYGMGLRIYPVYRKVKTDLWETTVMVGATHAEVYFCLKTLLDEVHHQQGHQVGHLEDAGHGDEGEIGVDGVKDVGRDLTLRKSSRCAGKGRCGARKHSVHQIKGTPRLLKMKGRTVPSACYVLPKDQPRGIQKPRGHTIVNIKLIDLQRARQDDRLSQDEFSKLLSTKHDIQEVLEDHFHPLTIKSDALPWNNNRRKNSYTLTINEDALHNWLSSKGRRLGYCMHDH